MATLITLAAPPSSVSAADNASIAARQRSQRTAFTDDELIDGFLRTTFGAEFHLAGRVDRIRKYETPVRVHARGGNARRRAQLAAIVADIGRHVRHLDIAMAAHQADANVTVHLIRERNFDATLTEFYGRDRAREIRSSLDPQCLSGFRKNDQFAITGSDVFLTVDSSDFIFKDCAYEELLQSLGPINDTDAVPWTMFNDDVQMGFFDIYDQHLLNMLYDPRIKAGMTIDEVKAVLPQVLRDVRSWVAQTNNLTR